MFCHPDRNQGREDEAGELTKVLLALREKKMKLTIEPVPQPWGNNLRSEANLSKAQWDKLRKAYKQAGWQMEAQGGKGSNGLLVPRD